MTSLFDVASDDRKRNGITPDLEPFSICGPDSEVPNESPSRRTFFKMTFGGAVAGLVTATAMEFVAPHRVFAQTALSPDAELQELMDGNRRFSTGKLTSCEHDLEILKQQTVDKQEPFAAVLSCADSRVPVELLFDQTIGHIFVTRIAGNVATSEIIASLEYGAAVLGTKVILVMGHANCGAVKSTIQGKQVPGQISALFPHIQPAVDQAGSDLEAATKANAKIQAGLLRQSSTVIAGLIKQKKIRVVAGYYDIVSGVAILLD